MRSVPAGISLDTLTPEVRAVLIQHIDENQLLSAALSGMRDRLEELERLVDSDTLTPLPNRRRFIRELERVVQYVKRYGLSAFVMFVDLDGLKAINDSHGHLAGDAALIHVAQILSAMLRTTDIVARIGGDEFGLVLEHLDEASAAEKALRLADAVAAEPIQLGGRAVRLSVSIGWSQVTTEDSAETVLERADARMYALRAERRFQVRSAR